MDFVAITLEGRALRMVTTPDGAAELRADEHHRGSESVFQRIDLSYGRVAFRTGDGRYLARHEEHPAMQTEEDAALRLVAELTQCAAFEELLLPGGYLSLRACDLRFLGVHTSGRVVADRVANGSWERFRYLESPAPLASFPLQADPTPGAASHRSGRSRCCGHLAPA